MLEYLLELKRGMERVIARDFTINPLMYVEDLKEILSKNPAHPLASRILALVDKMKQHRKNKITGMELCYLKDIDAIIKELQKAK